MQEDDIEENENDIGDNEDKEEPIEDNKKKKVSERIL